MTNLWHCADDCGDMWCVEGSGGGGGGRQVRGGAPVRRQPRYTCTPPHSGPVGGRPPPRLLPCRVRLNTDHMSFPARQARWAAGLNSRNMVLRVYSPTQYNPGYNAATLTNKSVWNPRAQQPGRLRGRFRQGRVYYWVALCFVSEPIFAPRPRPM